MDKLDYLYSFLELILNHAEDVVLLVCLYFYIKKNHSYANKSDKFDK